MTTDKLTYPEGLNEEQITSYISSIVKNLDRQRLMADDRLQAMLHPLLQERLGSEVALNAEISHLIIEVVNSMTFMKPEKSEEEAKKAVEILIQNALDPDKLITDLTEIKRLVAESKAMDDTGTSIAMAGMIPLHLETILKMPTMAQNLILYPAAIADVCEHEAITDAVADSKRDLMAVITDIAPDKAIELMQEIEAEALFVIEWAERRKNASKN